MKRKGRRMQVFIPAMDYIPNDNEGMRSRGGSVRRAFSKIWTDGDLRRMRLASSGRILGSVREQDTVSSTDLGGSMRELSRVGGVGTSLGGSKSAGASAAASTWSIDGEPPLQAGVAQPPPEKRQHQQPESHVRSSPQQQHQQPGKLPTADALVSPQPTLPRGPEGSSTRRKAPVAPHVVNTSAATPTQSGALANGLGNSSHPSPALAPGQSLYDSVDTKTGQGVAYPGAMARGRGAHRGMPRGRGGPVLRGRGGGPPGAPGALPAPAANGGGNSSARVIAHDPSTRNPFVGDGPMASPSRHAPTPPNGVSPAPRVPRGGMIRGRGMAPRGRGGRGGGAPSVMVKKIENGGGEEEFGFA